MLHGCHAECYLKCFTWGTFSQWPCCLSGQASHNQKGNIAIRWDYFWLRRYIFKGGGGVLVLLKDGFSSHFSPESSINALSNVICGASFGYISAGIIYLSLHVGIYVDFVPCFDIKILDVR